MKIEEQVLSREQMAHLVELGVDTSDASMYWSYENSCGDRYWVLLPYDKDYGYDKETIPAYTIGDLIEKLPKEFLFISSCESCTFIKRGNPVIFRHELIHIQDANLKDDLYEALCMIAKFHKELIK